MARSVPRGRSRVIALTNGIRDVANCDYLLSGTIRAIDAVLIAAGIALGVGLVLNAGCTCNGSPRWPWRAPREFAAGAAGWGSLMQWQPGGAAFPVFFSGAVPGHSVPHQRHLRAGAWRAGIYYTAYYFIMATNAMAVAKGVETFKIAVAPGRGHRAGSGFAGAAV